MDKIYIAFQEKYFEVLLNKYYIPNGYFSRNGVIINCVPDICKIIFDSYSSNIKNIAVYGTYNDYKELFKNVGLEYHVRQNGGGAFEDILNMITKPVEFMIKDIFRPVSIIGEVFMFLFKLLIWLILFIAWFIAFMGYILKILNPVTLLGNLIDTLMIITTSIISAVINFGLGLVKMTTQTFGNFIVNGFWGWDNAKTNKDDHKNSKYFKKQSKHSNQKCYISNPDDKVPFSVLLGTIIFPPVGVFMTLGLTGWVSILMCSILTIFFYFPGLLYGLCVIYC